MEHFAIGNRIAIREKLIIDPMVVDYNETQMFVLPCCVLYVTIERAKPIKQHTNQSIDFWRRVREFAVGSSQWRKSNENGSKPRQSYTN